MQDVYYNLIDEYKDFTASLSYGSKSLGASLSHSTHKGFGGSVNYGVGGISYSESEGFGVNFGMFSYSEKSGVGLSIVKGGFTAQSRTGSSTIEYDLKYNFKSKNLTFDFNSQTSIGILSASTGFSLSSKGTSSSSSVGIGGVSAFGGGYLNNQVSTTTNGWSVSIPILNTGFVLGLSSTKVKQYIYSNETNYSVGSSSFNHQFNEYTNPDYNDKFGDFHTTDVITQTSNPYELGANGTSTNAALLNSDDHLSEINFPAFDSYFVNSQGLSGDFSLKYFENISIPIGKRKQVTKIVDTDENDEAIYKRRVYPWERSSSTNKPYFYFNNEFSSYLELTKVTALFPNHPIWNLSTLSTSNSITSNNLYTSLEHSIAEGNGLNNINARKKRTGSFIESFTKDDIINQATSINFLYATNNGSVLDYNDIYNKTSDTDYAILGFRVTAIDGKTYHYSIPVYQKELISKTEKESNPNGKFNEHRNFSNYATHWLLTSVTGSDFIDMNSNNFPDENDYGYWVRFEYGKWSDGFGWETTPRKSVAYENCNDPINNPNACTIVNYNSRSLGVKEVYYLNKIKTRTHTALFLKSLRNDSKGDSFSEGTSRTSPETYDNVRKSMSSEDYQARISVGTFRSFYNIRQQNNFKLDKIVLIKNEDDTYYSNSVNKPSTIGGDFYFYESFQRWNILGQNLGIVSDTIHDTTWDAEFYNNILEVDDISNYSGLMSKSLVVIPFNYGYNLGGKLSLNSVGSTGHSNVKLIPDYKFEYYTGGSNLANTDLRWGYDKFNPEKWSIRTIKNPLGAIMTITYESDSYRSLENYSSTVYNEGGIRTKRVSLNNDTKIDYEYYDGVSSSRPEDIPNSTLSFLNYEDDVFGIRPQVFYRKVIEKNLGSSNDILKYNEYIFDIPQNGSSDLRRFIDYRNTSNPPIPYVPVPHPVIGNVVKKGRTYNVKSSNYNIKDNTKAFGRLLQKKTYNSDNQLLTHSINRYRLESGFVTNKHGVQQETFSSFKRVDAYYSDYDKGFLTFGSSYNVTWYGKEYYLMSASKKSYPSVLESTTTTQGGFTSTTNFLKHDFLTGQVLETTTTDSKGNRFKTEVVPAYTIPEYGIGSYSMGSKVDNSTNKNMLTQQAMSKTYIEVAGQWEETGVGISTWNNQWNYTNTDGSITEDTNIPANQKIWRKHKSFIWDGELNADGTYLGFVGEDDNFNWGVADAGSETVQPNPKWKNTSTTTLYDHYSMPLEARDINGNYAATKMGDSDTSKVLVTSNAAYSEMYL